MTQLEREYLGQKLGDVLQLLKDGLEYADREQTRLKDKFPDCDSLHLAGRLDMIQPRVRLAIADLTTLRLNVQEEEQ